MGRGNFQVAPKPVQHLILVLLFGSGVLSGCGSPEPRIQTQPQTSVPVLPRAASIETTACGHASKTNGAGVIVSEDRVLATAHVVIGSGELTVTTGDGVARDAVIVNLDTTADLALLSVPGIGGEAVELAEASAGQAVKILGGGPSGPVDAEVSRRIEMRIEGVRSTERVSRAGVELTVRVETGDSGAGVVDEEGRLVGVVYGRTKLLSNRSFAVGGQVLVDFLSAQPTGRFACDPAQHRVVPVK